MSTACSLSPVCWFDFLTFAAECAHAADLSRYCLCSHLNPNPIFFVLLRRSDFGSCAWPWLSRLFGYKIFLPQLGVPCWVRCPFLCVRADSAPVFRFSLGVFFSLPELGRSVRASALSCRVSRPDFSRKRAGLTGVGFPRRPFSFSRWDSRRTATGRILVSHSDRFPCCLSASRRS
jgi:hypothetical protein